MVIATVPNLRASQLLIRAARIQIADNVKLNGSKIDGKLSPAGSDIKGHPSCNKAVLRNTDGSTFNAVAYAVDLVFQNVALGQETAWAPWTIRGPWGRWGCGLCGGGWSHWDGSSLRSVRLQ